MITATHSGRRLGAFERAMLRTQWHSPFNVTLLLRFSHGPEPTVVARALSALQGRHGRLGCRLGTEGWRPAFLPGGAPIVLELVPRASPEGWHELVERGLAHRFDLERGPLAHAVLAGPDAEGAAELALTLPHLLIDASSATPLLGELLALLGGDPGPRGYPPLPAAPDLPRLEERFPEAHRGLAGRGRVLRALGRELAGEVRFASQARGRSRLRVTAGRSRAETWSLERAETSALLGGLRRRRLTLNSALVAAWSAAYAARVYGERGGPVRTFTMAGLRRLVQPPLPAEALGSGWAMMRLTVAVEPNGHRLADLAATVRDQLHRMLQRGEAFTTYAMAPAMMGLVLGPVPQRMGELAVSYTGSIPLAGEHGALRLVDLQAFVSTMDVGPALIVQQRLWQGRLCAGLVYHDHDLDRAAVRAIGERVRRELATLASAGGGATVAAAEPAVVALARQSEAGP